MNEPRIDTLRKMIADIGALQTAYHHFFPPFADQLVHDLGQYLGDDSSVALCCAHGAFDFNTIYRHEGLGFDGGRYLIPVMFRFKNLQDDGQLLVRIHLHFTLDGEDLNAEVGGRAAVRVRKDDTTPLLEDVYQHLRSLFDNRAWFIEGRGEDYSGTGIGFVR
jgi:hypothetical protein